MLKANKGEWSELYAFFKLLKDGRVYAADEKTNRIETLYLPIVRVIRGRIGQSYDYYTGNQIRIFYNNSLIREIDGEELEEKNSEFFDDILAGGDTNGAFEIPRIMPLMERMNLEYVKSPASEKEDITMQIQDINTGYSPVVGFSIKSDLGRPPTLFNSGKNTRVKYKISGFNDTLMKEVNSIDITVHRHYMILRMNRLFDIAERVEYDSIIDDTFESNLIMLDSLMPEIFGEFILLHYKNMTILDCNSVIDLLKDVNPINYKSNIVYKYKFKKLISAMALGMTAGKEWDGRDAATGGYIIVKKDGDVLCYHLYNRNFFEDYLIENTRIDRPGSTKHDFGYVYKEGSDYYIDLNIQIRFKTIR